MGLPTGGGAALDATQLVIKALDGMKAEQNEITKKVDALKAPDLSPIQDELKNISVKLDESEKEIKELKAGQGRIQLLNGTKEDRSFGTLFAKAVAEHHDSIRNTSMSHKAGFELKTVGDMTVAANLTGSAVATYQNQPALLPNVKVNFRSLVPSVQSATGIYKLYRETGTEGSISVQSTPGVAKTQIDYDFTEVTYTARYIAGYARIDKSMLQDLPFLQTSVSDMLLRDFYKTENTIFYNALSSVATGSTSTSATVAVEKLIDYIANLLDANFTPNAITVNARLWATLLKTKPSDYSIPGGVTIDNNGNVRITGIPIIPASWMPANKAIVGDWSMAKRVEVDGLKVEFFEQDADNVTKNLITVRVECREVLAIDRLDAFVFADLS